MKDISIGIDTSNYTTSLCAYSAEKGVIASVRRLLPVADGALGLRQSDAVFAHTKAIPELFAILKEKTEELCPDGRICAVGVSDKPLGVKGSYMPCFLAGVSAASAVSFASGAPLYRFSHQDGHIAAALYGESGFNDALAHSDKVRSFYAFHLSGGTCEAVRASREDNEYGFYSTECISRSLDVTCGQLIDRCGVRLGLRFPCGGELEKLAMQGSKKCDLRISCRDGNVNISGIQNKFEKMISDGVSNEDVASYLFDAVYKVIITMAQAIAEGETVVFSGGVTSSVLLKERIARELGESRKLIFAPSGLSGDNSVGIAILAMMRRM